MRKAFIVSNKAKPQPKFEMKASQKFRKNSILLQTTNRHPHTPSHHQKHLSGKFWRRLLRLSVFVVLSRHPQHTASRSSRHPSSSSAGGSPWTWPEAPSLAECNGLLSWHTHYEPHFANGNGQILEFFVHWVRNSLLYSTYQILDSQWTFAVDSPLKMSIGSPFK